MGCKSQAVSDRFAASRWLGWLWFAIAWVAPFVGLSEAAAQTPTFVRSTTWTESHPDNTRGLAYDGTYYYLGQIGTAGATARIDIFDETGLVRSIPKPSAASTYIGHGVAVDGQQKKIWTTDYGRRIFEFDFATGNVLRTIPVNIGNLIRLEYDGASQTFWASVYGQARLYNINMQGTVIGSFPTSGYGNNMAIALDGSGNLLVADGSAGYDGPRPFRRYSPTGVLLEEIPGTFEQYVIATNVNDRDAGFVRPSKGIGDISVTYTIEHYTFGEAFESMALPKVALIYAQGKQAGASGANNRGYQKLHLCGSFALGAGSDGIDPLFEQVVFNVGEWSGSVPPGSFESHDGGYHFNGDVAGAKVRAHLTLLKNGRYNYTMSVIRPLPVEFDNPLKVKISVGDDYGETSATVLGMIRIPASPSVASAD